jgi:hypothetical protein
MADDGLFLRNDVRETPSDTEATIQHVVSTGAQTIDTADGWVNVTGATLTIVVPEKTTIAVFGNVQAEFPAAIQDFGLGVRIDRGGAVKATRTQRFNYSANIANTTKVNVPVQFVETLNAGTHTIKLQAYGYEDGVGTKVTLPAGSASLMLILDKVLV